MSITGRNSKYEQRGIIGIDMAWRVGVLGGGGKETLEIPEAPG